QGHAGELRQRLGGLEEALALVLHDEGEDVPLLLAAEAVEEALRRVHVEGGRLLLVEGTEPLVVVAGLAELHVPADHRDDVGSLPDLADDVLGNQSHGLAAAWPPLASAGLTSNAGVSM